MKSFRGFFLKVVSVFLALNLLFDVIFPTAVYALTSGPASPEFSSFEPVATTDMVNVFSGDFTYNLPVINIPGPDGGGYALSLSYHSGSSVEEESSWVGYGWTLNPGAINRNLRGIPDEFDGAPITHYNKNLPNWTVTAQDMLSLEFFSKSDLKLAEAAEEKPLTRFPTVELSQTLRYNNYMGFNRTFGVGTNYKGGLSLNSNFASSGITFSANISVSGLLNHKKRNADVKRKAELKKQNPVSKEETKTKTEENKNTLKSVAKASFKSSVRANMSRIKEGAKSGLGASTYGLMAYEFFGSAQSISKYKGFAFNYDESIEINPMLAPVGVEKGFRGSFQMQFNEPSAIYNAYGYMHNRSRSDFSDDQTAYKLSDYYVEKAGSFDQRDLFVGIPFSNYDVFSLAGEGLSGGFRLFNTKSGHFYPSFVASDVKIFNIGWEASYGVDVGVGLNFGAGNTKFRVKDWGNSGNTSSRQFDGSSSVFRFNNDLGGKAVYADNEVSTASLDVNPTLPFIKGARPVINTAGIYTYANEASDEIDAKRKISRSSYVSPIYNAGKMEGFEVTKEDGLRYKYGQPVYSKNEVQVSVDVNPNQNAIVDNKFVFRPTHLSSSGFSSLNDYHTVVGEAKIGDEAKYPTAYLITEITTADYVDVNNNGPDDQDFGGWTKFEYEKVHENYRWKMPYTGLEYIPGQISSKKDDMGSVATGEKEIYYLRKITTKTHTAYFISNKSNGGYSYTTPTGVERRDGLSGDLSTDNPNAKGSQTLERLEKIVLVSNARPDKPVKTVNFSYTYELVPNLPNNMGGAYPNHATEGNTGKLTLKKVWFEYEGVVNARISPYEFFYRYKDKEDYSDELKDKYDQQLGDFFTLSDTHSDVAQNPSYSPYKLDAWGYNQPHGKEQSNKMRPWRYQGAITESYDPAAYQLKQIKLPSGGEILIEYEEKDYRYVQDRDVMAMVSLKDFDDDKAGLLGNDQYIDNPWYKVNLDDIGVTSDQEKLAIVEWMNKYYIEEENRIYFKFLFQLTGSNISQLNDCRSEYIDGYAKVKSVELDNGDIKVTIDGKNTEGYGADQNYPLTPRQACYDFYSTNRVGKYRYPQLDCDAEMDFYDNTIENFAETENVDGFGLGDAIDRSAFGKTLIEQTHSKIMDSEVQIPLKATVCKELNKELSYLKIPMCKPKKAGGCRVKRLLTYDAGMESHDAGVIYGNVYRYIDTDGLSSGVAGNEPTQMREENPLVTFIPKGKQSWLSRHTAGKDKEQTEGPIGESLLPGASIGHSRVVIENIYQGNSGDGFAIHTFHTVKDYPFDKFYSYTNSTTTKDGLIRQFDLNEVEGVEYSNLKNNTAKDRAPINAGLFSYNSTKFWATQGFRFIQNNMHGQPKSVEKYSGTYTLYTTNPDKVFLAFAQVFEYFEPGEKVRMLKKDSNGNIAVVWDSPGKEMDLTMESKSIKERTFDFGLETDITIALMFPPPIYFTMMPGVEYTESIFSVHATSKVINYPTIVRATKVYQDGIWAKTDHLAFDAATGQPLVSRTTDIYNNIDINCTPNDGSVYTLTLPAHWYYSEMGAKSEAEGTSDFRTNQMALAAGSIISHGENGNPIKTGTSGEYFEIPLSSIINASIQTFSKGELQSGWFDSRIQSEYNASSALALLNKVYRPFQSFIYKTDVTSIAANPVYKAGLYTSFVPFDFTSPTQDIGWIKTNEVSRYSPNGMPVEERDVLNIPSAAKFGYNFTMPVAVGHNCEYGTIFFEDFENASGVSSTEAHSGKQSLRLYSSVQPIITSIDLTNRLKERGGFARIWLKTDQPLTNHIFATVSGTTVSSKGIKIAQTGDWSLYHFAFESGELATLSDPSISIDLEYSLAGEMIYIDDVRFQPKDAEMSCFVYDKNTLRLLAQFDDQHFGLYYQYNDEGKLVRKLIETEKGMKTVQETQYNTPKVSREP